MSRRVAILIVCGLAVIVAVWTSASPAPERVPDASRAVLASETCSALGKQLVSDEERMALFVTGLKEHRLDCGPSNADEVYRFTWVAAFRIYHPITVSIMRTGDVVVAVTREY